MVLKARENSSVFMENSFRIGVGAAPDHRGKQFWIVVLGQERIEGARRLRLRDNGIELFVPVILDAQRIFMQDGVIVKNPRRQLAELDGMQLLANEMLESMEPEPAMV